MKKQPIEIIVLEPDDGYVLTDAPIRAELTEEWVYSQKVYLGINDSPENWREIPETDVPVADAMGG